MLQCVAFHVVARQLRLTVVQASTYNRLRGKRSTNQANFHNVGERLATDVWWGCGAVGLSGRSYKLLVWRAIILLQCIQPQQFAVAVTSPGLFKEWVTTEKPGRLPLGPVVLLGQLSGRPIVLVCVCAHLCFCGRPFKGQRWQTGFNIFSTLSKWSFYCLVWFARMLGWIQKMERSGRSYLSCCLKFWFCLPVNPKLFILQVKVRWVVFK